VSLSSASSRRLGNPFFTVEAADGEMGAAHAFYAIGQQRAIGYSGMGNDGLLDWFTKTGINSPAWHTPAGMDSPTRLFGFGGPGSTKPLPPVPAEYEAKALSQAFLTLSQIAPQILEHQSKGTIAGVAVDKQTRRKGEIGELHPERGVARGRGAPASFPTSSATVYSWRPARTSTCWRAIICMITFTPDTPGPPIAGLAEQEAGRFDNNGKWVATHFLGGDDSFFGRYIGPRSDRTVALTNNPTLLYYLNFDSAGKTAGGDRKIRAWLSNDSVVLTDEDLSAAGIVRRRTSTAIVKTNRLPQTPTLGSFTATVFRVEGTTDKQESPPAKK
jgi:hypothetical protein